MATGHVRKRTNKDGTVSYQVIVEDDVNELNGKRQRYYRTIQGTKKEAEAVKRKMMDEVENGGITTASSLRFGSWLYTWLDNYNPNLEATTRAGYKERINSCIIPTLGNIPLKSLRTSHIQTWANEMKSKRNLSAKTIKNAYHNINASLKKAVTLKMIPYNPCEGVVLPKGSKYKGSVLTKDEVKNILKLTEGTDLHLMFLILVSVGLRRGELVALQWSDIDFDTKTIYVSHNTTMAEGKMISKAPKSEAGIRDITIGDTLLEELRKAHEQYLLNKSILGNAFKDSNLVISKADGSGYRPDSITQKWERFLEENNLRHIRLHDLRHTCATLMLEAGINPKVVQHRLGHSDIQVTLNIYAHCTQTANDNAALTLENAMFA